MIVVSEIHTHHTVHVHVPLERNTPTLTDSVNLPNAIVLDCLSIPDRQGVVARLALALSDQDSAQLVANLKELLLSVRALDSTEVPVGRRGWGGGEGGREREQERREGEEGGGRGWEGERKFGLLSNSHQMYLLEVCTHVHYSCRAQTGMYEA